MTVPTLRTRRIAGFGLVELAVALAVLSALLYFLLDRVLYMQEMGEKTEMDETVRSINYALRLEAASRMARGAAARHAPLEQENPVQWLQAPPRHYLGEMARPPANAQPAYWYWNPVEHQFIYRPNRSEHLKVAGVGNDKSLRFTINIGADPSQPLLQPVHPYEWR